MEKRGSTRSHTTYTWNKVLTHIFLCNIFLAMHLLEHFQSVDGKQNN